MKKLLPIFVLIIASAITAVLVFFKPTTNEVALERPLTSVEFITAQPEPIQLTVHSQGTVLPRTETDLSVEVSGRIIEMSDNFRAGAYIEKDEVLLRIDPADYEAAVATRAADVASAQLTMAQEEALGIQAAADWDALGEGKPSALTLRKPQLAQARARVDSANATLKQAQRDLARTAVTAPYSGRVLSKSVDLGQYVSANPAAPIARIYATEFAEIRLPITEREATFLDISAKELADVRLTKSNGITPHTWHGKLIRMEATIDPSSRLLYAVAEVKDPFTEPAMRRGLFVEADITGRTIEQAYALPRHALRGSHTVYVLSENNTLQTRTVEIVNSDAQHVIILNGLKSGEQVAISPIAYFIENMPVEIIEVQ
jgi:RND family efflux transporter MFP subunit|tara:strand:- start:4669 stop:5787 length:1119 start_codon:yes stop_codon:yes gene_type:complete